MAILGLTNSGVGVTDADARYVNMSANATTPNIIAAAADIVPLIVRAYSSQTNNLFDIQTFGGGASLFTVGKNGSVTHAPSASTGSVSSGFKLTLAAHTAMTASTEFNAFYVNGTGVTQQFATGAITTQRCVRIDPPTYAFVGSSTITNAATFAISGAPAAGTNATITNAYSLWVQAGTTKLASIISESAGTSSIVSILKGYSGQSANLQEYRNSSDAVLSAIDGVGNRIFAVVNAAGTTAAASDVSTWANNTFGIVKGTGGRIFQVFKNASGSYSTEMTAI